MSMLRRYVILQGLRMRVREFGLDILMCILLTVAFCITWRAHYLMEDLKASVRSASHVPASIKSR
jgi:hypothetical protein